MNISTLIYYLSRLIKDGHKWQYTNINGKEEKPKLYFSFLQFIAILISIYFLVENPYGLSATTNEYILECLSIMVALFISLLLVLFDKSKPIMSDDQEPARKLHSWNFFYQFNALTSYAILLSLCVIILIIISLTLDTSINILEYQFIAPSLWTKASIILFFKCLGIICLRFVIVYFLIDFFIISLYAICSIYQFMYLQYKKDEPKCTVYNETDINVTFKEDYGFNILYIKIPVIISLLLLVFFIARKIIMHV